MSGFPHRSPVLLAALLFAATSILSTQAQQADESSLIRRIDAAAMARVQAISGYTVTERYTVYRGEDETHSVAEMVVKTTYREETGKSYEIVSQTGSSIFHHFVFAPLLDNEKTVNLPGNREKSWLTSANYEMHLKPGPPQQLDGRTCLAVSMSPREKAPNLLDGTLWVDIEDATIVRIDGISSKSPSAFTGPTHMSRQYVNLNGFAMATHARGESDSVLLGRTVVTIDYKDYQIHRSSRGRQP